MSDDLQHWQYETFKAHWRERPIRSPSRCINNTRLAAVFPLADFSFDHQDLLLKPAEKKP